MGILLSWWLRLIIQLMRRLRLMFSLLLVSAGVNGQDFSGNGSVSDGATPLTRYADVGYHIASITVNGQVWGYYSCWAKLPVCAVRLMDQSARRLRLMFVYCFG